MSSHTVSPLPGFKLCAATWQKPALFSLHCIVSQLGTLPGLLLAPLRLLGVPENQNDRVPSDEQLGDEAVLVDLPSVAVVG